MNRKKFQAFVFLAFALSPIWHAAGQAKDTRSPYPTMAPIEQYLMANRDAEIALLLGVRADSVLRYREVDAWRDLAMEIAHGSVDVPTMPVRSSAPTRTEPTTERTEAPADGTGSEA